MLASFLIGVCASVTHMKLVLKDSHFFHQTRTLPGMYLVEKTKQKEHELCMQNGNCSSAKWPEGTCKDIYHRQDVVCGHTVASTHFMGDDDILWFLSVGSNDGTVIWI